MLIRSKRIWIANNFIPAIIEVEDKKIKRILEYDKDMKVEIKELYQDLLIYIHMEQ